MKKNDYLTSIPIIRVYQKYLIDSSKMIRMAESETIEELFKNLQEHGYGEELQEELNRNNYENSLLFEVQKLYNKISGLLKENKIIDIFNAKYKYNNFKVMIKAKFLNKDLNYLLFDINGMNNKQLSQALLTEDYKSMPDDIAHVFKTVIEGFKENKDPQMIDILLDNLMFENINSLIKNIKDQAKIIYRIILSLYNSHVDLDSF